MFLAPVLMGEGGSIRGKVMLTGGTMCSIVFVAAVFL